MGVQTGCPQVNARHSSDRQELQHRPVTLSLSRCQMFDSSPAVAQLAKWSGDRTPKGDATAVNHVPCVGNEGRDCQGTGKAADRTYATRAAVISGGGLCASENMRARRLTRMCGMGQNLLIFSLACAPRGSRWCIAAQQRSPPVQGKRQWGCRPSPIQASSLDYLLYVYHLHHGVQSVCWHGIEPHAAEPV